MRHSFLSFALFFLGTASCSIQHEVLSLPAELLALEGVVAQETAPSAWFGVEVELDEPDSLDDIDNFDMLELRPGVRIARVENNSPADHVGLRAGDFLLSFQGTEIQDPERLDLLLAGIQSAQVVTIQIERAREVIELDVALEVRSQTGNKRTLYFVDRALVRAAFTDSSDGKETLIHALADESPLLKAGAQQGDVILEVNGRTVGSAAAFTRTLALHVAPGDTFTLLVRHSDGSQDRLKVRAWHPGRVLTEFVFWPLIDWEYQPEVERETLRLGDLIFLSIYKRTRIGDEIEQSILGFFSWRTGVATLESEMSPLSEQLQ